MSKVEWGIYIGMMVFALILIFYPEWIVDGLMGPITPSVEFTIKHFED